MKRFLFLLIAATLSFTACSVTRRITTETQPQTWEGVHALDIMQVMGNPDVIDEDGRGGSIIRYKSVPDDLDPSYDILDPEVSTRPQEYAYFYLDDEGVCYRVETNRNLPAAPSVLDFGNHSSIWFDLLVYLPLFLIGILL